MYQLKYTFDIHRRCLKQRMEVSSAILEVIPSTRVSFLNRCDWSADDFEQPCFPMMYSRHAGECSLFIRSAAACQTTKDKIEPRQQLNTVTSYLDGSVVYGSSKHQAEKLRALNGKISHHFC